MRGALPNPESTMLLLGGVAMSRKAYNKKVPYLDCEEEKFRWEYNKGLFSIGYAFASQAFVILTKISK